MIHELARVHCAMYIKGKVYLFKPCVVGLASMMSDRLDQKYQLWVVFDGTRTRANAHTVRLMMSAHMHTIKRTAPAFLSICH